MDNQPKESDDKTAAEAVASTDVEPTPKTEADTLDVKPVDSTVGSTDGALANTTTGINNLFFVELHGFFNGGLLFAKIHWGTTRVT